MESGRLVGARALMIERLQRIATFLNRLMPLIYIGGVFSLGVLLLSVLEATWPGHDRYMIPSLLGFCWALSLFSLASLFRHVPAPAQRGDSLRLRLAIKLRRGLLWLFGLVIVALGLSLLVLSYQLLRTWSMS